MQNLKNNFIKLVMGRANANAFESPWPFVSLRFTLYGGCLAASKRAYFTGMRFNEIFGLSLDDLFAGELEDEVLKRVLSDRRIKSYGYIVLESQPKSKTHKRMQNGQI